MEGLKRIVVKALKETADKIDSGNSNLTEQEAMDLMRVIAHEEMSKEDACIYLNVRRSRFDELVRERVIPKGRKIRGFKELRWYKDDLMRARRTKRD